MAPALSDMSTFRQKDVATPHLRLPFQFSNHKGAALVNEQDSAEDILDCVKAIVAFQIGSRHDLPEFGIPELPFQMYTEEVIDELRRHIEEWEDRAPIDVDGSFELNDEALWKVLTMAGITGSR